jgi:trigger factor
MSDMKVVINEMAPCKRGLEVEIPPERVTQEMDRAFEEYARHARIPGFRQGHIPRDVVRRRFGKDVRDEVVGKLVREEALRILEEKKIDPVDPPVLEEVKYEEGKPLAFRATFEIRPDIQIADYKKMAVSIPKHEVTDEMVESYLHGMADRAAKLEEVTGRPVQKSDYIVGTLSCRFVRGKGKNLKDEKLFLEAGSDENHPDFNAAILGMSAGESRTFEVEYPEDYNAATLRGCVVEYSLALAEIKKKVVPPLDDDLAKEFGTFSSLQELRSRVREEIERRAAEAERSEARQRILADLVQRHPGDVPSSMVEAQLDSRLESIAREMIARGVDPTKAEVNWPEERDKARPAATDAVRAMLILDAIAAHEGIAATEDDVNAWLKEEARRRKASVADVKDKLAQSAGLTGVRRQIVREKSLDFLLQDATITREVR